MTIITVAVGLAVVAISFGLMIWGRSYLGEEQGRNPKPPGKTGDSQADDHACVGCGSCAAINSWIEKEADKGKSGPVN